MQVRKLFIIVVLLFITNITKGQEKKCFQHYKNFDNTAKGNLYLGIENLNFVHNNEYESKFTNGATWIGNIISPKIYYYPSSKIRLETGLRIQKYSGLSNYSLIEPLISIHYQAFKNLTIIVGNLNQDNNHKISEAIFACERFFTDKAESGVQSKYKDKRLDLETWLVWDNFITAKSDSQERINYGLRGSVIINKLNTHRETKIYGELFFSHKGGEVNSDFKTKKYRQTLGYFSGGISQKYKLNNTFINWIQIKAIGYLYSDNSNTNEYIISDGHAFTPEIKIANKYSFINLSYWNSYNFVADKGNELYWSISKTKIHYNMIKHRREIAIVKTYIEKEISKGILISCNYKNYFDLKNGYYDFSLALYLRMNLNFLLNTIK